MLFKFCEELVCFSVILLNDKSALLTVLVEWVTWLWALLEYHWVTFCRSWEWLKVARYSGVIFWLSDLFSLFCFCLCLCFWCLVALGGLADASSWFLSCSRTAASLLIFCCSLLRLASPCLRSLSSIFSDLLREYDTSWLDWGLILGVDCWLLAMLVCSTIRWFILWVSSNLSFCFFQRNRFSILLSELLAAFTEWGVGGLVEYTIFWEFCSHIPLELFPRASFGFWVSLSNTCPLLLDAFLVVKFLEIRIMSNVLLVVRLINVFFNSHLF